MLSFNDIMAIVALIASLGLVPYFVLQAFAPHVIDNLSAKKDKYRKNKD